MARNPNRKRWGRGDAPLHLRPLTLLVDPLAKRRAELWNRAMKLGLSLSDAVAWVATILNAEASHATVSATCE